MSYNSSVMNSIKSLYIHFPFCSHRCNYCDFYKKVPSTPQEIDDYERYLTKSWNFHERLLEREHYSWGKLDTLYLGGGTPSLWGSSGAIFLKSFLEGKEIFFSSEREVTLEVNPGGWTEQGMRDWWEIGVNRCSLGIQSLEPFFLKTLDRVHSLEDIFASLEFFNKNNINYSIDFMLGLPASREKKRDILGELEQVLYYEPKHISLYILTLKEGHSLFEKLADEDWVEGEYLEVASYLQSKGYLHYEVSNFAKLGKESRHNLRYWNSETVGALGPSATGFLAHNNLRYKWKVSKPDFTIERLASESARMERFYSSLRLNKGPLLEKFFNKKELLKVIPLVEKWCEQERGVVQEGRIRLNSKGFFSMDDLMEQFFKQGIL